MKRCEYCDSINPDDARVCVSCGGASFVWKCVNCGTEFKDRQVCPGCGVTVGQAIKTCPRCKATYYTLACPSCGYTPEWTAAQQASGYPGKKRHTALWVLGWIFFFPIPLTVLIVRSKKLPVWAKALLLVLLWGFVIYSQVTYNTEETASEEETSQVESFDPADPDTTSNDSEPEVETEPTQNAELKKITE